MTSESERTWTPIRQMTRWPHTPSYARIKRARRFIQEQQETGHIVIDFNDGHLFQSMYDARWLDIFQQIPEFETWANQQVARLRDEAMEQLGRPWMDGVMPAGVAAEGSGEDCIGMLTLVREPGWTAECPVTRTGVTALIRNPGWVGMNARLPDLTGLEVRVVEDESKPGSPWLIAAATVGIMKTGWDDEAPFPRTPLNDALQRVFRWHGAIRCAWHPRPGPGRGSRHREPANPGAQDPEGKKRTRGETRMIKYTLEIPEERVDDLDAFMKSRQIRFDPRGQITATRDAFLSDATVNGAEAAELVTEINRRIAEMGLTDRVRSDCNDWTILQLRDFLEFSINEFNWEDRKIVSAWWETGPDCWRQEWQVIQQNWPWLFESAPDEDAGE